jgi:hypothetical protein
MAALAFGILIGSASAGTPAPSPSASVPATVPTRQATLSLRDLGQFGPLGLKGVDGAVDLPFGVRLDEVVVQARLRLHLNYSPALIESLSHLKVSLNGQVIAALPLPKAQAGGEFSKDLDIDPRLFTDFNHLQLQLIGHYTTECEDPGHSSLWLAVGDKTTLELGLRPLVLQDDLAILPAPFFDRHSSERLDLPVVLAAHPSPGTLHAAGVVASWFGAQADYRSARFPVLLDSLPQKHALVFAANNERPAGLQLPQVEGPALSIIDHPQNPAVKLLVIQGRDAADLEKAAQALVLGQLVLGGASATVTQVDLGPRRAAYDVPRWIRSDRPVRLGELVDSPSQLQAAGHVPPPLRINLRLAPDLLAWNRAGVPIDLRYRYTPPIDKDNSMLSISINDQFVRSYRLTPEDQHGASRLLVPLLGAHLGQEQDQFLIPAFQIGADNQLQFQFVIDYQRQGLCRDPLGETLRSGLDPDSTIDLSGFPHFTAMPNLALFANAGYPFSRFADLAETAVVLPDQPAAADLETYLYMLGRMGRFTGAPALRFRLLGMRDAATAADADLLVIGAGGEGDILNAWKRPLSLMLDGSRRSLKAVTRMRGLADDPLDVRQLPFDRWQVSVHSGGALAAMLGFESPLKAGRSVVAVAATAPAQQRGLLDALDDGASVDRMRGDTVVVRSGEVDSFQAEKSYYLGSLPLWKRVWFFFSKLPLLVLGMGVAAGVILAFWLFAYLQRAAARRISR